MAHLAVGNARDVVAQSVRALLRAQYVFDMPQRRARHARWWHAWWSGACLHALGPAGRRTADSARDILVVGPKNGIDCRKRAYQVPHTFTHVPGREPRSRPEQRTERVNKCAKNPPLNGPLVLPIPHHISSPGPPLTLALRPHHPPRPTASPISTHEFSYNSNPPLPSPPKATCLLLYPILIHRPIHPFFNSQQQWSSSPPSKYRRSTPTRTSRLWPTLRTAVPSRRLASSSPRTSSPLSRCRASSSRLAPSPSTTTLRTL